MESIEKVVEKSVNTLTQKFETSPEIKSFEKINTEFETLVKKGIVQKRGNRLLSSSENHLKSQVWFNVEEQTVANKA